MKPMLILTDREWLDRYVGHVLDVGLPVDTAILESGAAMPVYNPTIRDLEAGGDPTHAHFHEHRGGHQGEAFTRHVHRHVHDGSPDVEHAHSTMEVIV